MKRFRIDPYPFPPFLDRGDLVPCASFQMKMKMKIIIRERVTKVIIIPARAWWSSVVTTRSFVSRRKTAPRFGISGVPSSPIPPALRRGTSQRSGRTRMAVKTSPGRRERGARGAAVVPPNDSRQRQIARGVSEIRLREAARPEQRRAWDVPWLAPWPGCCVSCFRERN